MKIAWVTGGGTGIGRALAQALYRQGASVMITGRRQEVLEKTVQDIRSHPAKGRILFMAGDASDPAHVSDVLKRIAGEWGPVDLLINNAATNDYLEVSGAQVPDYEAAFKINCLSAIRTTEAVLPGMRKARQGSIVNISSMYGKWGSAKSATYTVSKFALAGYTDALRQSLFDTPIHVLGVYPGFIQTDMTSPFVVPGSMKSYLGKSSDQMARQILSAVRRRKAELLYPWYVPWVLRLQRWFPVFMDQLAQRIKR